MDRGRSEAKRERSAEMVMQNSRRGEKKGLRNRNRTQVEKWKFKLIIKGVKVKKEKELNITVIYNNVGMRGSKGLARFN